MYSQLTKRLAGTLKVTLKRLTKYVMSIIT